MISVLNNIDNNICQLFKDVRFHMGASVLEGLMGQAYTNNIVNPEVFFLTVRSYCFISGNIKKEELKEIIDSYFKEYILIPSDNLKLYIEELYGDKIEKYSRYSFKKKPHYDKIKLEQYASSISNKFSITRINKEIADRIKQEKFMKITDDYEKYGIGYCCIHENQIIGVVSSNIFYKDGIEMNIKVHENYRRNGIALAMAAKLILTCLKEGKTVSCDSANLASASLATKLGYEVKSAYDVYEFEQK